MMRFRPLFLTLGAIAMIGCRMGSTETPPAPAGMVSFDYTSPRTQLNGSYRANGAIPGTYENPNGSSSWAFGTILTGENGAAIFSGVPKNPLLSIWDEVYMSGAFRTEGTKQIVLNCIPPNACVSMDFWLNRPTTGGLFQYHCQLITGSLTVTATTPTNIAGVFQGSGSCFTSPTAVPDTVTIEMTNGSYNVTFKPQ